MKEKTITALRERHEKEIRTLQTKCKHAASPDWIFEMWAPGHFSGQVKICKFCGKTLERRPGGITHSEPILFHTEGPLTLNTTSVPGCEHDWHIEHDPTYGVTSTGLQTKWRCKRCLIIRFTYD